MPCLTTEFTPPGPHVPILLRVFVLATDPEAPVSVVPTGLPRGLHRRLRVQAGLQQEMAEHAAPHHWPRPLLQCAQRRGGCHGSHAHATAAACSRSDRLQVLEPSDTSELTPPLTRTLPVSPSFPLSLPNSPFPSYICSEWSLARVEGGWAWNMGVGEHR